VKVILSANPYRDKGLRVVQQAAKIFVQAGVEVVTCLSFTPHKDDHLSLPKHLKLGILQNELPGTDLLVCFGGDGTILHASREATRFDIPVLGVNLGSIGFIAELERGELALLAEIAQGRYLLEERMLLQVKVLRGGVTVAEDLALNDAVFSKYSASRVAELEVLADGMVITRLMGDGVIVCTPTGSTAYSMSAGGPIVEPTSQGIMITPVCAHQLTARSIVLDSSRTVTVRLPKGSRKTLHLSVDGGRGIRIGAGDQVEICRSKQVARFARLKDRNFYQVLNQKLGGYGK